jgi:hypothetical protein
MPHHLTRAAACLPARPQAVGYCLRISCANTVRGTVVGMLGVGFASALAGRASRATNRMLITGKLELPEFRWNSQDLEEVALDAVLGIVCFRVGGRRWAAAAACCRAAAGLLQGCCGAAAGLLQGCCRAAAGLLRGICGRSVASAGQGVAGCRGQEATRAAAAPLARLAPPPGAVPPPAVLVLESPRRAAPRPRRCWPAPSAP